MTLSAYHPTLNNFSFIPEAYIKDLEEKGQRIPVTKVEADTLRLVTLGQAYSISQVVLHDLLTIASAPEATLEEKNLAPLAAELFMMLPENQRYDFYARLSGTPKVEKVFAIALKNNAEKYPKLEKVVSEEEEWEQYSLDIHFKRNTALPKARVIEQRAIANVLMEKIDSVKS